MFKTNIPINFPNQSRSYDRTHNSISFWGSAATIDVTFQIPCDTLQRLAPGVGRDEASILRAFDSHRPAIETAARSVYAREKQTFCRLSANDLPSRG